MTGSGSPVRWRWVVAGAVVAELGTVPIGMAFTWIYGLFGISNIGTFDPRAYWLSPPIFFVTLFLSGFLAAHFARSRYVLHGALVGVIAALIFLPMLIWMPYLWKPAPNYILESINEAIKVAGGALGGAVAGRMADTRRAIA